MLLLKKITNIRQSDKEITILKMKKFIRILTQLSTFIKAPLGLTQGWYAQDSTAWLI